MRSARRLLLTVCWTHVPASPLALNLCTCSLSSYCTLGSSRNNAQVMSLVPPEQGTEDHPEWKRAGFEDEDATKELHVFVSLYGIFKAPIDFPNEPGSWLVRLLCFSFKWTLQLLLQMAKGVVMCHQADVVHCDLEPWNFMFDAYGRLKIIDFGMSIRTVRAMSTAGIL
jgi:serine/threonine protein kinase